MVACVVEICLSELAYIFLLITFGSHKIPAIKYSTLYDDVVKCGVETPLNVNYIRM